MPMKKVCPRCGATFDCMHNDILSCHCATVRLDALQRTYLMENYSDCLCHDCLKAVKDSFYALLRGFEGLDEYTRFYIGWLQMNGMGDTDFDDAAKFARVGMSVNISDIFDKHLLIRTGNKQHLATYKERVVKDKLGIEASDPLIDQVHRAMDNWHSGDRKKYYDTSR